jgi:2-oxoglutarate ferredoxin oxidoreductase subunit delta
VRLRNPIQRQNATEYIYLDTAKCKACWKCIEACPNGVIDKVNLPFHKHARISCPEHCKGCLKCAKVCSQQAITPVHSKLHSGVAR